MKTLKRQITGALAIRPWVRWSLKVDATASRGAITQAGPKDFTSPRLRGDLWVGKTADVERRGERSTPLLVN